MHTDCENDTKIDLKLLNLEFMKDQIQIYLYTYLRTDSFHNFLNMTNLINGGRQITDFH